MKNLIIVGFGYLGHKVAECLSENSTINIYGISRHPFNNHSSRHSIVLDLDSTSSSLPLSKGRVQNSHILYLAPPPNSGQLDTRIENFFQLLRKQQSYPKKIVLVSTTGVYGNCHGAWIDEQQPLNPMVDRAFRRTSAEQQLTQFCENNLIDSTILRVAGIYAEDKLPIERLKKQQPLVRKEESPYSNRIHADDLTDICIQALNDKRPGIFNCADGHPSTMYEYFSGIASALKLPQPPTISLAQAQHELSAGMLSYMNESRRINNKKLMQTFKLKLKYPRLDEFLKEIQK